MWRELYTLFMSYQNKKLDNEFINSAFNIMMKYESITNYVNDFKIVNESNNKLGSYSNETRIISINKASIVNDKNIHNKKLLSLQVLRHELEHARNLKRLYEHNCDIKTSIIRYSLREYAIKHGLYYESPLDRVEPIIPKEHQFGIYNIDPGERLAEINAWKFIVNLLKNQRRTDDLLIARSMLYYSYIRGYKNNGFYFEPPTYEYLLKSGLNNEYYLLRKKFNYINYSFDTRLLCGLPISQNEYNQKILEKVKLQKRKVKH